MVDAAAAVDPGITDEQGLVAAVRAGVAEIGRIVLDAARALGIAIAWLTGVLNVGHVLLVGILDNLGKGASGAAVQSLNLMLGLAEDTGLSKPRSRVA